MTGGINYNKILSNIDSDTLNMLYRIGFKLVPLSINHIPSMEWSVIYKNPQYWKIEILNDPIESSKFKNVASTVGNTHIKDLKGNELFIQVLDADSEHVYEILHTSLLN